MFGNIIVSVPSPFLQITATLNGGFIVVYREVIILEV